MNRRSLLSTFSIFFLSLILAVSCSQTPKVGETEQPVDQPAVVTKEKPIVIGYSNWAGWWPWAIAEQEGIFAKNNVNVEMKWFDGYIESMEALAVGQLDGNCQTLNDTISFVDGAINGSIPMVRVVQMIKRQND